MPLLPRPILAIFLAFLALAGTRTVTAQESSSPAEAAVFAPGAVSIEGGNVYRGAFSPDGREFWFFRKVTEGEEDYRIFVSRNLDREWGEPERVLLGGEYSELYPSISPDGGRMVFTSYRPVPGDTSDHPNANLWYVDRRPDGGWGTPVFMEAASTLANYDNNPRFRPDGAIEFGSTTPDWSTNGRFLTRWDGTRYGPPEPDPLLDAWADWRDDASVGNATLSPDSRLAILDVRQSDSEGRAGPSDLWFSRREGDGWSEPEPLEAGVNTPEAFENFAVFSPDGREIHFVRGFHLYWRVSTDVATSR
ncbi:MAG: TolB family protein [Gemmatimonadota bacterium]